MKEYRTITGFGCNDGITTDSAKYYLCYNCRNSSSSSTSNSPSNTLLEGRYIGIFKGTGGSHKYYTELSILLIFSNRLVTYGLGHVELAKKQRFIEGDVIYELTDTEIYNHLVLEGI